MISAAKLIQDNHNKVHMRTHTGENPYLCSECKKSFKSATELNMHNSVHQNNRPHPCTVCRKAFKTVVAKTDIILMPMIARRYSFAIFVTSNSKIYPASDFTR